MSDFRVPIFLKAQSILAHPDVLDEIRGICQESREIPTGPYGIPILEADWLEPDEYFMGDSKIIRNLDAIAKKFGPTIAREILLKLVPPDTP